MAASYLPPVDRLLRLGREPALRRIWPDYAALGLEDRHVPALIRMATDRALLHDTPNARHQWAPLHAWRALGQLRAASAVEPLLRLLREEIGVTVVSADLPVSLGMVGGAALPSLTLGLFDEMEGPVFRGAVAQAITTVGIDEPDRTAEAIAILAKQLEDHAHQDRTLNGALVAGLVDLRAADHAPLIEAAFDAGSVDEEIAGTWEDAQVDLGLVTPLEATGFEGDFDDGAPNLSRQPAAGAAEKAKKRRKAEKQSRKRNRKKK